MSDYRDLIRKIKTGNFAPIYILTGEEPYYIDQIVNLLEQIVVKEEDKDFDLSILYGADTDANMVMEASSRFPFMSDRRLVILKEAQSMQKAKDQLDKLKPYLLNPNPSSILCIAFKDKLNATSEFIKTTKKNHSIEVFESPKIKEYKIGDILRDYCFENKIKIEEKAIELLVANVGASLSSLISELEKLSVALHGNQKNITADIVNEHIGVSKEFNNFELVAALSQRNYFHSLNIVANFENNPKSNPTVVTLSSIFTFFQRLLIASFNPDKGDKALMEILMLKTPYALREIKAGLRSYNASQLVQAIHIIRDFDIKSKGIGSYQKEFPLLRQLVINLLTL